MSNFENRLAKFESDLHTVRSEVSELRRVGDQQRGIVRVLESLVDELRAPLQYSDLLKKHS